LLTKIEERRKLEEKKEKGNSFILDTIQGKKIILIENENEL